MHCGDLNGHRKREGGVYIYVSYTYIYIYIYIYTYLADSFSYTVETNKTL